MTGPETPGVPGAADLARELDADGVLILAAEGQDLTVAEVWPPHDAAGSLRMQVGFGVTGTVARTGKPLLIHADSPRNVLHREILRLAPNQTIARMCLPLRGIDGSVVGVLAVHRAPDAPFTAADQATAESYVPVLGLWLNAQQLWRAVNRNRTERDQLIKQAITAQEAERRRIAFDLHDGVTTALASMSFHLSAADFTVSSIVDGQDAFADLGGARVDLGTARELADLAYNQTRAAISGLHSLVLHDLGLVAAIESLAQTAGPTAPTIDLAVDPDAEIDQLPDHVAAAVYRIAQEALSNAVKYAQATRIVLSLRQVGDRIVFGCSDDGVGFDVDAAREERSGDAGGALHFGLSSIAERCAIMEASLRVESAPGRGTTVLVELPN